MDELDEEWLPMVKSWRLNDVRSRMDSNSLKGYNMCITRHSSCINIDFSHSHIRTLAHVWSIDRKKQTNDCQRIRRSPAKGELELNCKPCMTHHWVPTTNDHLTASYCRNGAVGSRFDLQKYLHILSTILETITNELNMWRISLSHWRRQSIVALRRGSGKSTESFPRQRACMTACNGQYRFIHRELSQRLSTRANVFLWLVMKMPSGVFSCIYVSLLFDCHFIFSVSISSPTDMSTQT